MDSSKGQFSIGSIKDGSKDQCSMGSFNRTALKVSLQ